MAQPSTSATLADGWIGVRGSDQPISASSRSPLRWLQRAQAATTFVHSLRPPRDARHDVVDGVGLTLQYTHRWRVAGQHRAPGQRHLAR